MDVYKTDPLRYYRSLVIYLNELSLSDQTSHVTIRHWRKLSVYMLLFSS